MSEASRAGANGTGESGGRGEEGLRSDGMDPGGHCEGLAFTPSGN